MDLRVGDEPGLRLLLAGRPVVLLEDLLAEIDALVADVDAGARDELAHLVLALPAEGAPGVATAVFFPTHRGLRTYAVVGGRGGRGTCRGPARRARTRHAEKESARLVPHPRRRDGRRPSLTIASRVDEYYAA